MSKAQTQTPAPTFEPSPAQPGPAQLAPELRELLEFERRQLLARVKIVERILGIAPKEN